MQTTAAQSPPFGYLSPPIDGCDAASEDGDALHTPVTDDEHHHQPYAVYHQHQHSFSHELFGAHHMSQAAKPVLGAPRPPSTPDKLRLAGRPMPASAGGYFPPANFSPPYALDLANASLEFNPFAASFAAFKPRGDGGRVQDDDVYAQDAPAYDTSGSNPFDFISERYTDDESAQAGTSADSLEIPALPSLSISTDALDVLHMDAEPTESLLLAPAASRPNLPRAAASENLLQAKGRLYSPRFPAEHSLNPYFVGTYDLGDELGAGGYGFVMTARNRLEGHEVAVKFIIKDKVPDHAWWDDEVFGRIPTEVMIMSLVEHENIVKCLDVFEDELYFYLVSRLFYLNCCRQLIALQVQELHGTPWISRKKKQPKQISAPGKLAPSPTLSTPSLTPSPSTDADVSLPSTPPQVSVELVAHDSDPHPCAAPEPQIVSDGPTSCSAMVVEESADDVQKEQNKDQPSQAFLQPVRPSFSRRPSYDLFECIEQSKHKRLSENNARYIFAQVVEAVYYLNSQGITHCDIKDENLVIDSEYRVCSSISFPQTFTHAARHAGQAHRLRQRRGRRPVPPRAALHALLRHYRIRRLRDPAQAALPRRAGRGVDARRAALVPAHGPLAVPDGAGRDRRPRRPPRARRRGQDLARGAEPHAALPRARARAPRGRRRGARAPVVAGRAGARRARLNRFSLLHYVRYNFVCRGILPFSIVAYSLPGCRAPALAACTHFISHSSHLFFFRPHSLVYHSSMYPLASVRL